LKLEVVVHDPNTGKRYANGEAPNMKSEAELEAWAIKWAMKENERRVTIDRRSGIADPLLREIRYQGRFGPGCWAVKCLIDTGKDHDDIRWLTFYPVMDGGALSYATMMHEGDWCMATEKEELEAFERHQPELVKTARAKIEARANKPAGPVSKGK